MTETQIRDRINAKILDLGPRYPAAVERLLEALALSDLLLAVRP